MSTKERTPETILEEIRTLCEELGWEVGVDISEEEISGAVIGIQEYVQSVILQLSEEEKANFKFYEAKPLNEDLH